MKTTHTILLAIFSFLLVHTVTSSPLQIHQELLQLQVHPRHRNEPRRLLLHNVVHLNNLEITECPLVESIAEFGLPTSMLKAIKVSDCRSLKSLPKRMHNLTSLQELCIESFPSLVSFPDGGLPTNLSSLSIMDCEKFKPSFEWGLHRLTCLTNLAFGGCQGLVSFPEDWLLPISLSSLQLQRLPNPKFLPNRLNNLTSLDNLEISKCDILQTLFEEEQPKMLQNFEILGSPLTSGCV